MYIEDDKQNYEINEFKSNFKNVTQYLSIKG